MNKWLFFFLALMLFLSCKHKKKNKTVNNGPYFSVVSFIQAQAKHIDSSLYRITKVETADNTSDTTIISREAFRSYAKDFLDLPDIASPDKKSDYDESSLYDESLNNVIITYIANDPDEEIRRETVMSQPDANGNSQVQTIIVNRIIPGKDSTVEKDMTWHVDRRFQVVTKVNRLNQPEKIRTLMVQWE